jgi:hypothetical protein
MYSTVLITPVALLDQANAVGEAMGWGSNSYSIQLTTDGTSVTHYGLRADSGIQLVRWIKGLDPLPEEIADLAAPVLAALISDFRPDPTMEPKDDRPVLWGRDHLDAVLADNGMTIFQDDGE